MHDVPPGVLVLYTANTRPYAIRSRSTTVREFLADPLLKPKAVAFKSEAPLLVPKFQVDKLTS